MTEELSLEGIAGMVSIAKEAEFNHDNFNTLPVKSKSAFEEEEDVIDLMEKEAATYHDSPFTKDVNKINRNVDA